MSGRVILAYPFRYTPLLLPVRDSQALRSPVRVFRALCARLPLAFQLVLAGVLAPAILLPSFLRAFSFRPFVIREGRRVLRAVALLFDTEPLVRFRSTSNDSPITLRIPL